MRDVAAGSAELITAFLSRVLSFPFTLCIPRDPRLWLVIGRENGKYVDNAKHFFDRVRAEDRGDIHPCFLSEHAQLVVRLRALGASAVKYPSLGAFWTLLRAAVVVVDSMDFQHHGRVGLLRGARITQLWHGAPLKEIEVLLHRRRLARLSPLKRTLLRIRTAIIRRYPRYDLLISTSGHFSKTAFMPAFRAERTIEAGYPRNDAMLDPSTWSRPLAMLNVDVGALDRLRRHRVAGGRVVAYAPTFRKDWHSPFEGGRMDLARFSEFCREHGLMLVLKLHPLMRDRYSVERMTSIIEVQPESDIYPLLREVDVLITDYSSIYFDFLLLDRPLIFYPYDLETYASDDRALLFDYESMTPGPKAFDFDSLLCVLTRQLQSDEDPWRERRRRVRGLTFDHHDYSSTARIRKALA